MPTSSATISVTNLSETRRVDLRIGAGVPQGMLQLTVVDIDTGRSEDARIGNPFYVPLSQWENVVRYGVRARLQENDVDRPTTSEVLKAGDVLVNLIK